MVSWTFWLWIGMLKMVTEPALMETTMTRAKIVHRGSTWAFCASAVDERSPRVVVDGLLWSREVIVLLQKRSMFM